MFEKVWDKYINVPQQTPNETESEHCAYEECSCDEGCILLEDGTAQTCELCDYWIVG